MCLLWPVPLNESCNNKQTLTPVALDGLTCCYSEEMGCLAMALVPVCAEVFFEDGGEGQAEMRTGESCFAGLAVYHGTRCLVFLNYAKLHLGTACQRLHL